MLKLKNLKINKKTENKIRMTRSFSTSPEDMERLIFEIYATSPRFNKRRATDSTTYNNTNHTDAIQLTRKPTNAQNSRTNRSYKIIEALLAFINH